MKQNVKETMFHGGQVTEWELKQVHQLKEIQGFNLCENEYYSCC